MGDISGLSLRESSYQQIPFGKEMLKQFLFDSSFKNLNHGSFGAFPSAIRYKASKLRDQVERQPDPFIRYIYPKLLDESREAVANVLNVPASTVVFVPNATTGVNTVLRNMVWNTDGKDDIMHFNTIYGACGNTVICTCEASEGLVRPWQIQLQYPIEDEALLSKFKIAIEDCRTAGRRPRIAIFDVVSSLPGVRMPFEALTTICHEENILSLIDGAHGIGHVQLDLTALNPDFFVSNCHKWLHVPRGCAVFHVPLRNQPLIGTTLPTSHGYIPRSPSSLFANPLPESKKSAFVTNFEFVGTLDNTPYLCVPEALKWREEAAGGEDTIIQYCQTLAREGGQKIAEMLGTDVLDNETHTITQCCFSNVRLPLKVSHESEVGQNMVKPGFAIQAETWILDVLMEEFKTFIPIFYFQDTWWARLSGQVYLDMSDFGWAGRVLKEVCDRVGKGEYLAAETAKTSSGKGVIGTGAADGYINPDISVVEAKALITLST